MNIAKLNTASLDDKTFIIKRGTSGGGSTPDTPSGGGSGGGELEGEYYLARPNGWYWKLTDELLEDRDLTFQATFLLGLEGGTIYEVVCHDGNLKYKREMKYVYRELGTAQYIYNNNIDADVIIQKIWVAISEAAPSTTFIDNVEIEFQSFYDLLCMMNGEISEEEFALMMLSQFKIQRITKEEYEALLTE